MIFIPTHYCSATVVQPLPRYPIRNTTVITWYSKTWKKLSTGFIRKHNGNKGKFRHSPVPTATYLWIITTLHHRSIIHRHHQDLGLAPKARNHLHFHRQKMKTRLPPQPHPLRLRVFLQRHRRSNQVYGPY
jgi:hypothetical protein